MFKDYTLPDYHNSAIVNVLGQIDMLTYRKRELSESMKTVEKITNLLNVFRTMNRPIIHAVKIYRSDGSNAELGLREDVEGRKGKLMRGSDGVELIPELFHRQPHDTLVNGFMYTTPEVNKARLEEKNLIDGGIQKISDKELIFAFPRWGVFHHSPLDRIIKEYNLNTLIFMGMDYFHHTCPSIYQAADRDLRLIAVRDAIHDIRPEDHDKLEHIGVNVFSSNETVETAQINLIVDLIRDMDL